MVPLHDMATIMRWLLSEILLYHTSIHDFLNKWLMELLSNLFNICIRCLLYTLPCDLDHGSSQATTPAACRLFIADMLRIFRNCRTFNENPQTIINVQTCWRDFY